MEKLITLVKSEFDSIKQSMLELVPSMDILGNDWKNLQKKMVKRLESAKSVEDIVKSGIFIDNVLLCFCSNLVVKKNRKQFIDAFNKAVTLAQSYAGSQFEKKVTDLLKSIYREGDGSISVSNSAYKNYLHELLVFNYLSNCKNVEVIDIERKIENGNSVDFVVRKDNKDIGFEVVTLQGIDPSKQDDDNTMGDFIYDRLKNKYLCKTKGLGEINNLDQLYIIPVIEYHNGMENFKMDYTFKEHLFFYPIMTPWLHQVEGEWCMELCSMKDYLETIRKKGLNNCNF